MLSTHKVEVVQVFPRTHPNADKLEVCDVFGGYPCVVGKWQFSDGELAAYLPPDSVVDLTRPEFAFLAKGTKTKHRVKCVKLRGVASFGLLMPAPDGSQVGDDVAAYYGVEHYEPPMKNACTGGENACTGGEAESAPGLLSQLPKYDIDSLRRYVGVFEVGEPVFLSEKLHGASARYSWMDGRLWVGSRSEWKRYDEHNLWWKVAECTPSIKAFCEAHPGFVLFGECYGQVQDLTYGTKKGEVRFAAFDVLTDRGAFLNAWDGRKLCEEFGVPCVPFICEMPFDFDAVCQLSDGPSLIEGANHCREGCVVKPLVERFHQAVGRAQLKVVGSQYLSR